MQPSSSNFHIISTLRYDPDLPNTSHIPDSYPSPQNSPYYLLSYHHDRLLNAALDFQWPAAIALLQQQPSETVLAQLTEKFDEHISSDPTHPWRLRVLLDAAGDLTIEAVPIISTVPILMLPGERPDFSHLLSSLSHESNDIHSEFSTERIETWTLRIDTQPMTPSLFTRHKTTARDNYTASRMRAGITSPHDRTEVLIYNPAGEVMEGSITSVYFRRQQRQSLVPSASVSVPERTGDSPGGSYYWVTPPLSSGGNAGTSRRYALAAGLCVEEVVRVEELQEWDGEEGRVWLSNGVRGFVPAVLRLG
ncbi:hypothetical protein EMCG_02841 [[Emmonsia] crescens]|uniref:Aminodeoxychorismate lyase n=1 Tax=[Emmonsia] crescens TaxID=73230 RepID=A0A0G2HXG0_9EURO|nr:hypothetical protein EMCG_02841 [Emmonsia crescens UAMH 3008]